MPELTSPAAPPRGTVRTLARILPFVRPFLGRTIISLFVYVALVLVVAQRTRRAAAGSSTARSPPATPRRCGRRRASCSSSVIAEGLLIMLRRWFVLTPSTHIEAHMRNTLYEKLQDLPVSFHDRWQSGQLLSRSMGDLGLIRRWLAFGVILLVGNVGDHRRRLRHPVHLVVAAGADLPGQLDPDVDRRLPVRAQVLGGVAPRPGSAGRPRDHRRGVGARHPRAEGVRARQAQPRAVPAAGGGAARHRAREGAVRSRACGCGCCSSRMWRSRLSLLGGVVLAASGQLTVGGLVAFFAAAAVLRWPIESIGWLLSMTFETRTAVERIFEVLDEPDLDPRPRAAVDDHGAPGPARVRQRALPLPGHRRRRARPARRHRRSRWSRARRWRWSVSPVRARPRSPR